MPIKVGNEYFLNGSSLTYKVYHISGTSSAVPNLEKTVFLKLTTRPPLFSSNVQRLISVPELFFYDEFRERGLS